MFSFIYTLIKYTIGNKSSIKNESDEINNVIARIENAHKKEIQEDEYFNKDANYYKIGNITLIDTDYVVVDDFYICDTVNISINNLKMNHGIMK